MRNANAHGSTNFTMKSPSSIVAKDKRLDMLASDLRKSIERLDKVIYANKSNINTAKKVTPNKQSIYSDKADNNNLVMSADGMLTTGGNSEINFNTQFGTDTISVSHANALARKTPLKSISSLKKHSFIASTFTKKSPSSIATTNKGIRNNKSIVTGMNTKTASKYPQPTQPPHIITQPDDISDKVSSKSYPIKGVAVIENRKNNF